MLGRLIEGVSLRGGFEWDLNYEKMQIAEILQMLLRQCPHFISNLNN